MTHIRLTWTWVLESPLHCGTGLSRPGVADALVARDEHGKPVIPGDAVKGALRMSAEQLLGWLGHSQAYASGQPSQPRIEPLASVFGASERAHFQPGRLGKDKGTRVLASTAIDPDSGVALGDTLRQIEVVNAGSSFSAAVDLWVEDGLAESAQTLLVAALLATESVGGRTVAGLGRVKLDDVKLKVGGTETSAASQCSPERLRDMVDQQATVQPGTTTVPKAPTTTGAVVTLAWFRLELGLDEPATFTSGADVGHQAQTRDLVPATALRGALWEAWRREGRDAVWCEARLGRGTRWSPGWPTGGADLPVPVSRSWQVLATRDQVRDLLTSPAADGEKWKSMRPGWLAMLGGEGRRVEPVQSIHMHVARDYGTGAKVDGALYARGAVATGSTFVAWAQLPDDTAFPKTLFLGRRRSAGGGRATLTATRAEGAPTATSGPRDRLTIHVQLLSPALVLGPGGYPVASLLPQQLLAVAWAGKGTPAPVPKAEGSMGFAAHERRGGWMSTWGHPRAPQRMLSAGTTWALAFDDESAAAEARTALQELARRGLGERLHEGLGWLVIDPLWLPATALAVKAPSPPSSPGPSGWPGLALHPSKVGEILRAGSSLGEVPATVHRPLQGLGGMLRGGLTPGDCLNKCVERARASDERAAADHGKSKRPWSELGEGSAMHKYLRRYQQNPQEFALAVETLLIRSAEETP